MMDIKQNLTEGNITKKLIVFSVPFLLANLLQALYSVIDMLIVGWFSDPSGISAIAIGGQITWLLNSLVSGLTMGGTVLIAQYIGSKREKDLLETMSTLLTMFIIAALVLTVVMLGLTPHILKLINTPKEAFQQAKTFVYICVSGTFFIFGYNAISGILRGMGDSKSPLVFVTISCITNIILDFILVGAFRMGAKGAAFATVTSQALSMCLAIIHLYRNSIFDFKISNFKISKTKAKLLIKIGIPSSMQDTFVNLSFIFITSIVNSYGVNAAAAVGIAGRFDSFAMLPASAMAMAIASTSAQNVGAGLHDRAKQSMKIGIRISLSFAIVIFLFVQIYPEAVLRIFTSNLEVIKAGALYMRAFSLDFIMVSFVFCMDGFFNGCGHSTFAMANGLLSTFLVRVPLAYILSKVLGEGLFGVGLAAPFASSLSIILGGWYILSNRWKKSRIL